MRSTYLLRPSTSCWLMMNGVEPQLSMIFALELADCGVKATRDSHRDPIDDRGFLVSLGIPSEGLGLVLGKAMRKPFSTVQVTSSSSFISNVKLTNLTFIVAEGVILQDLYAPGGTVLWRRCQIFQTSARCLIIEEMCGRQCLKRLGSLGP